MCVGIFSLAMFVKTLYCERQRNTSELSEGEVKCQTQSEKAFEMHPSGKAGTKASFRQ